jgi:Cu+-exporting ATPase
MTMKESKAVTKDPICGMTVDEATALHAERDGKTFYFCSDHCRKKFLSRPPVLSRRPSLEAAVEKNAANDSVISVAASRVS